MRKKNVVAMMMCFGLAVFVALPVLAQTPHEPIPDETGCNPNAGVTPPDPDPEGGDCYDFDPTVGVEPWPAAGYCIAVWPEATAFAPMPQWQLDAELVWYEGDPGEYYPDLIAIHDNYPVDLPAYYDFCAWMDQLYCSFQPFFGLLPELELYGDLLRCGLADINGEIDECFDIPMLGNGIPDQYELEVLAAILNDNLHPLHVDAVAAIDTNLNFFVDLVKVALSDVDTGGGNMLDARMMSYGSAAYLIPSLAGLLAAYGTLGDAQTNVVLDELLILLEDLGIEPIEGGVAAVLQGVDVGADGDPSGNGFTNMEIYNWFIQLDPLMTSAGFAAKALDPAERPPAKVVTLGGGNFAHDVTQITLTADVSDIIPEAQILGYQWYEWLVVDEAPKDPQDPFGPMCDVYGWVAITDQTGSQLELDIVEAPYAGRFAVGLTLQDATKVDLNGEILASTTVTKEEAPPVPVSGSLGLALFAGACALAGAVGIRRRK